MLQHMTSGMNLLRRKNMRSPTPFISDRIAFLDPPLCAMWCANYNIFNRNPKQYIFDDYLIDMFKGEAPMHCKTHKMWLKDVDTLYVAHNVQNVHWVALEIDLHARRIKIYDCAVAAVKHEELMDSVKTYSRMIPYLIQHFAPKEEKQKMSLKAFTVYKVKSTPINAVSGDCGIYTLKFIECLALGHSYANKLADKYIPFIRMKFGIEVMTELPIPEQISSSDPNPRSWEIEMEKLNTASQGLLLEW